MPPPITHCRILVDLNLLLYAVDIVDGWLELDNVTTPHPGRRHSAIVRSLLADLGSGGNLVADAHLAALAIEHGLELCSRDADFSRFPGLRWVNPIDASRSVS